MLRVFLCAALLTCGSAVQVEGQGKSASVSVGATIVGSLRAPEIPAPAASSRPGEARPLRSATVPAPGLVIAEAVFHAPAGARPSGSVLVRDEAGAYRWMVRGSREEAPATAGPASPDRPRLLLSRTTAVIS